MKWSRLLCPLQVANKSFKTLESFDWLRFPYWLHLPVPATASLLMAEKRRGWASAILVALQFYIFHSLHSKKWLFSYFKSAVLEQVSVYESLGGRRKWVELPVPNDIYFVPPPGGSRRGTFSPCPNLGPTLTHYGDGRSGNFKSS